LIVRDLRRAAALIRLAKKRFDMLSTAERKTLLSATTGQWADCGVAKDSTHGKPSAQPNSNCIRGKLLTWLCTDRDALSYVRGKGIRIRLARIEGGLNLNGLKDDLGVALCFCTIQGIIDLRDAHLANVILDGSICESIYLDRAEVQGSVFLRTQFEGHGTISLRRTVIGGDFDCSQGRFLNADRITILLDNAEVGGNVKLMEGFHAEGEVRLNGATIKGNIDCTKGQFCNFGRVALRCDTVTVTGDVILSDGFLAHGEVWLLTAEIKGEIDCTNARIINERDDAISLDLTTVEKSVRMSGSHIEGVVRLAGATVKGDLECAGLRVFIGKREDNISVNAADASIGQNVLFQNNFQTDGVVNLSLTTVGGLVDFSSANFTGRGISGLFAHGASLGRRLSWTGIGKSDDTTLVLYLLAANVGEFADDSSGWPKPEYLWINGFTYKDFGDIPSGKEPTRQWLKDRVAWLRLQTEHRFSPQPYEQLAHVLERTGHEPEARYVAIAKQDDAYKYGRLPTLAKISNRILRYTIGHGYQPHLTLWWGLAIVVIGALVFRWGQHAELLISTKKAGDVSPKFNAFTYSVDAFLPIINFRQEDYWIPSGRNPWSPVLLTYYMFHVAAGWILSTLGVLGVTGLVRKR